MARVAGRLLWMPLQVNADNKYFIAGRGPLDWQGIEYCFLDPVDIRIFDHPSAHPLFIFFIVAKTTGSLLDCWFLSGLSRWLLAFPLTFAYWDK